MTIHQHLNLLGENGARYISGGGAKVKTASWGGSYPPSPLGSANPQQSMSLDAICHGLATMTTSTMTTHEEE